MQRHFGRKGGTHGLHWEIGALKALGLARRSDEDIQRHEGLRPSTSESAWED